MAWTDWPPVNDTTDYHRFSWIEQIPQAIRERSAFAMNSRVWPMDARSIRWQGKIDAIVDNGNATYTITALHEDGTTLAAAPVGEPDVGKYWDGSSRAGCGDSGYW